MTEPTVQVLKIECVTRLKFCDENNSCMCHSRSW